MNSGTERVHFTGSYDLFQKLSRQVNSYSIFNILLDTLFGPPYIERNSKPDISYRQIAICSRTGTLTADNASKTDLNKISSPFQLTATREICSA